MQEPTFIPVHQCTCGYRMDAASDARGDASPVPGDVSLCLKCAKVWLFDEGLLQREPSESELADILSSDVGRIVFELQSFIGDKSQPQIPGFYEIRNLEEI